MRHPGRSLPALLAATVAVLTSTQASYALWSAQARATLTVTTTRPLPAPTGFRCTEVRNNDVSLAWTAVPGASEYVVVRRSGAGPAYTYSHPVHTPGTSLVRERRTTWGVPAGGSAVLVVRAVGTAVESPDSSPVTVGFGGSPSCTPAVAP